MADNVTLPGTGVVIASDDVASVQYQYVKLDVGGNGASTPVTSTGLPINDAGGSVTVDGTFWQATQPVSGTVGVTPGTGAPRPDNNGVTLLCKSARYTSQQTGVALWTPASGKYIVITSYCVSVTGTVGGDVVIWSGASGDTTYTRGTDAAVFDGNFIPSVTFSPGAVQTGVWKTLAVDDILRVTTSAAINYATITVWGYETS